MREQQLLGRDPRARLAQRSPIYFLIASVYFENRFEFYDLVVKRGAAAAAERDRARRVPGGDAAVARRAAGRRGAAVAVRGGAGAGGDGDAVAAVAHRAAGSIACGSAASSRRSRRSSTCSRRCSRPPTKQTLIAAAEARLSEIFGAKIVVLVGSRAIFEPAIEIDVKLTSPVSGAVVRIAVIEGPAHAPLPLGRPGAAAVARRRVRLHAREHPAAAQAASSRNSSRRSCGCSRASRS